MKLSNKFITGFIKTLSLRGKTKHERISPDRDTDMIRGYWENVGNNFEYIVPNNKALSKKVQCTIRAEN